MVPHDYYRKACHEASHAVLATALGWVVDRIEIDPTEPDPPYCEVVPPTFRRFDPGHPYPETGQVIVEAAARSHTLRCLKHGAAIALAGMEAERVLLGRPYTRPTPAELITGGYENPSDWRVFRRACRHIFGKDHVAAGKGWPAAEDLARRLVAAHAARIKALAGLLVKRGGFLPGRTVRRVFKQAVPTG